MTNNTDPNTDPVKPRAQSHLNRREFLTRTLAGTGALMAGAPALGDTPAEHRTATDLVPLGKTGIQVSRLALGTGSDGFARSSAQTRLGEGRCLRLLRHGYDAGITFVDMADLYGSHDLVRKSLKGRDRDAFVLLSKIWVRRESWNNPSGGAREEVERYLKELDAHVLDVCLIHCTTRSNWPREYKRVRDELSELKAAGTVRAVGTSCHDFGALEVAAEHPWVDVIFARINHRGGRQFVMDGTADEVAAVLKRARANGKAVVGMKIFGNGKLTSPAEKDASLRYVFDNELIDAMTIGMLNDSQIDDSIQRIDSALQGPDRQ